MDKKNVIKIDLCNSKVFFRERQEDEPDIRVRVLTFLQTTSKYCFPENSYYRSEGDAVYFIVDKSTVAIRSSIEFMKSWFYNGVKNNLPECRILIHRGTIRKAPENELTGEVFEDISVIESNLEEGKIFLSEEVRRTSDATITKYVYYKNIKFKDLKESIRVHYLAFDDPRTFEDDSLAHLLFIVPREAQEVRNNIFKFFIIEYLMEHHKLIQIDNIGRWLKNKGYPSLPKKEIIALLSDDNIFSKKITEDQFECYFLRQDIIDAFNNEKLIFDQRTKDDLQIISEEIIKSTQAPASIHSIDIHNILREYLCGIFSEIRMMANYFRDTFRFYNPNVDIFKKYNYIIERHLDNLDDSLVKAWVDGFINGLKKLAGKESIVISAIFHNILGGYYLNKHVSSSPYQEKFLKERIIYIDTNVLYSLRCISSNYNELVQYFTKRLESIGLRYKIYPFTINEFEESLKWVENEYKRNSRVLMKNRPWLYQEFMSKPYKYANDMASCREYHSVTKGLEIKEDNFDNIGNELLKNNVVIERQFNKFGKDQITDIWERLRHLMLSKVGTMEKYWEISDKIDYRDTIIEHDVNLMENISIVYQRAGDDAFGPKVFLITTDNKLVRCREKYPFVITIDQFMEFILPYLFLADIPTHEFNKFPNQILSAQLGVHITRWKPSGKDLVSMIFSDPECLNDEKFIESVPQYSKNLNIDKLKRIVEGSKSLANNERENVINSVSELLEKDTKEYSARSFLEKENMELTKRVKELELKYETQKAKMKYYKRTRKK